MRNRRLSFTSPIIFLPVLLLGCTLLFWITSRKEEVVVPAPEISEQGAKKVSAATMLELRQLKEKLAVSTSEVNLNELTKVFGAAVQRERTNRDFLLQGMLRRSEHLDQRVSEEIERLTQSNDKMERLLGDVQKKLHLAKVQNEKWGVLSDELKQMNALLETHNELKDPENILKYALESLLSNGGQLLYRSYRWAYVVPIVAYKGDTDLQPGIGTYRIEEGQFKWRETDYPDPYGVITIPDAYQLFAQEDPPWKLKRDSPYTHIRVIGSVDLSIPMNISIKHNSENKRLLTIVFPAPRLSNARLIWDGTTHGTCLIEREPPYNLKPFVSKYQSAWEYKLKKIFLTNLSDRNAIDPEEFIRGIANLLSSTFEQYGYAVTFSFPTCDLPTLIEDYIKTNK